MFEKMKNMAEHSDHIRRLLLCEPRGSVVRHLNLIVPSTGDDCDVGLIVMEPTEYVPMSGSNTIAAVTVMLETGILAMEEPTTVVHPENPDIRGVTIVPSIRGSAWITGFHTYILDPEDPWPQGYFMSDTWGVSGQIDQ